MRIIQLAIVCILGVALAACGLTPREKYTLAATAYDVADTGAAIAEATGKLKAGERVAYEQPVQSELAVGAIWLQNNPQLADVPGAPFPPLNPINFAILALKANLKLYQVPTTVPATNPG